VADLLGSKSSEEECYEEGREPRPSSGEQDGAKDDHDEAGDDYSKCTLKLKRLPLADDSENPVLLSVALPYVVEREEKRGGSSGRDAARSDCDEKVEQSSPWVSVETASSSDSEAVSDEIDQQDSESEEHAPVEVCPQCEE
jgi:hypothetical protein